MCDLRVVREVLHEEQMKETLDGSIEEVISESEQEQRQERTTHVGMRRYDNPILRARRPQGRFC